MHRHTQYEIMIKKKRKKKKQKRFQSIYELFDVESVVLLELPDLFRDAEVESAYKATFDGSDQNFST